MSTLRTMAIHHMNVILIAKSFSIEPRFAWVYTTTRYSARHTGHVYCPWSTSFVTCHGSAVNQLLSESWATGESMEIHRLLLWYVTVYSADVPMVLYWHGIQHTLSGTPLSFHLTSGVDLMQLKSTYRSCFASALVLRYQSMSERWKWIEPPIRSTPCLRVI